MDTLKARGTRIWQTDLGTEYESPAAWLWEDVVRMEGPEGLKTDGGGLIRWHNEAPKTLITLACGTTLIVLGKFATWDQRWSTYLHANERRGLLFTTNN